MGELVIRVHKQVSVILCCYYCVSLFPSIQNGGIIYLPACTHTPSGYCSYSHQQSAAGSVWFCSPLLRTPVSLHVLEEITKACNIRGRSR